MAEHGTRTCYQYGCRCGPCRKANSAYARRRGLGRGLGDAYRPRDARRLEVTCWCEETMVWLPVEMVRACRTVSCGAPDCREAA